LKWKQLIEILHENSPHDYERYIAKLNDFDESEFFRKIKAFKFVISKVFQLRLYAKKTVPESQYYARIDNRLYGSKLAEYDVISLNLFDTFLIKNVMDDSDVYSLIGMKLEINGFCAIRQKAEQEAIKRIRDKYGKKVPDLYAIYEIIQEWCDIEPEIGISTEIAVETAIYELNPYWFETICQLIRSKKIVLLMSDAPLHEMEIRKMLEQMGLVWKGYIFTACDCGVTKESGKLFEHVKGLLGNEKRYIHIGDNRVDDVHMAKIHRWDSIFYQDVHKVGRPYRRIGKSVIVESITGGIINTTLHNGIRELSALEEFGFNYFGRLHIGYCQWLNHLVKSERIDKLLFVSRDGYLIKKIYDKYFGEIPSEYIYVSRYALSQITVDENMESFIRQNLSPVASESKMTVAAVFEKLQLEMFVPELEDAGIKTDSLLCKRNLKTIKSFLYYNKKSIAKIYGTQCDAAVKYFKEMLSDSNRVCVVDIGWHGTCIMGVMDFISKHLRWSGEVIGAQIGLECDEINIGLNALSKIRVYAFSPTFNVDLYKRHDFGLINVIDEIVFSAPEPSLLQYAMTENGEVKNIFAEEPQKNVEIVKNIQNGVLKYVEKYNKIIRDLDMQLYIPAQVAYRPVIEVVQKRKYIKDLLGKYKVQRNCGISDDNWKDVTTV